MEVRLDEGTTLRLRHVRRTVDRWRTMSTLLHALEHVVEGTARLDAYVRDARPGTRRYARGGRVLLDERMQRLERRLDREVDRLTAELLDAQLAEKMRRDRQSAA